ncbi:RNA polymerase sigma factor [Bacillus sp. RG28]|uniref:RNA polymerase sigma factor n=1 Tax=Gottfriedia endophytica TaxID=2820819 RepID=A0A940SI10_9BACI|nr:RNA polymerase sigma factor [Gottfriedia endophytica]MBP0726767.1 RNA polymerase sigma factor [Gottfriedia endophytica]
MSDNPKDEIENWYDQHSQSVLSFILLMVKDYQQAEDLTHDTFVKAYLYYDSFKQHSSEKTWLFSIAHNITIDFLRKRKPFILFKEFFHFQKDNNPLPEEVFRIKEESYELYKALEKIKDTYRRVIILRKIKGFSIEDTAKILGWTESKVKSTLFRAIPVLRKQLKKEGDFDEEAIFRYRI